MTELTAEDVLKLSKLAKIKIGDDELESYASEISSILSYIDQLQSLDLKKYQPTSQVTGLTDVSRPDEVVDYGMSREDLLNNVPATSQQGHIEVPRIIQ